MRQGGQRTHAQQSLQVPVCLPRRAGRIDDLVGPAMSTRGPLGCPSQMSRIPPADRQSISRLPQLQPCGPPFSFAISHMARMVYGSSSPVHPPLPPRPLFPLLPYTHTHITQNTRLPIPVPTAKYILPQPTRLAAFGTPAQALHCCLLHARDMQNAPARDLACSTETQRAGLAAALCY